MTKDLTSQRLRHQSTGIIKNPLKNLFVHGSKIMLRDQQILRVDRGPQKRGGHSLASCFFSKEELQALTVQPNQLLEHMASVVPFYLFFPAWKGNFQLDLKFFNAHCFVIIS